MVTVELAQKGEIQETVVLSGQVTPRVHINVLPEVPGKVKKVSVEVGDRIEKGQLLFQLDGESQRLQLEQARAALRLVQLQLDNARSAPGSSELDSLKQAVAAKEMAYQQSVQEYQQMEQLFMQGAVGEQDVENAKLKMELNAIQYQTAKAELSQIQGANIQQQVDMLEAQEEQAQISVQLAELLYDKMTVKAPVEGTVAMVNLKAGEMASPSMPAVILADMDTVYIQASLPEGAVNRVQQGLTVQVFVPAVGDQPFEGMVEEVSFISPEGGRAYPVKIILDNSQGLFMGGMYARLEVPVEQREEALLIPLRSVIMEEGSDIVYVVEDNKAVKKKVRLGLRNDETVEVLEGLQAGARVITRGQNSLMSGMGVEVLEEGAK